MSARPGVAACAAEALRLLRRHAYYADRVDWAAVGAGVETRLAAGGTLHEVLGPAILALGDRHSHLQPAIHAPVDRPTHLVPASTRADRPGDPPPLPTVTPPDDGLTHLRPVSTRVDSLGDAPPLPTLTSLDDGVTHLLLPGWGFGPSWNAPAYVQAAWAAFRSPLRGCVLDLRGNGGGSVVPMLAAAGPLLGPGAWLRYRRRDGSDVAFRYCSGTVATTRELLTVPDPPADVPDLAVALLADHRTASAAEGVLVAFRGRIRTRLFGTPTAGVPTGNQVHTLGDGSRLVITSAVSVDRDGATHDRALLPDEPGEVETALAWLREQ